MRSTSLRSIRLWWASASALCSIACGASTEVLEFDLDQLPSEGVKSRILAYSGVRRDSDPAGYPSVRLIAASKDLASTVIVDDLEPASALTVFAYRYDLRSLGLEPGPIPIVADGRPIPAALHTARATFGADSLGTFEELQEIPDDLANLEIPTYEGDDCNERGGCFDDIGTCILPCLTSAPIEPATPTAPEPPDEIPCPDGWISNDQTCGPQLASCSALEAAIPGQSCLALTRPCAGTFAANPPAGAMFVDPSASAGGNGTSSAPFKTLAEALVSAPDGTTLMLSTGHHVASVDSTKSIALMGACASTVLSGSFKTTGNLELENLAAEDLTVEAQTITTEDTSFSGGALKSSGASVAQRVKASGTAWTLGPQSRMSTLELQSSPITLQGAGNELESVYLHGEGVLATLEAAEVTARAVVLRGGAIGLSGSARLQLGTAFLENSFIEGSDGSIVEVVDARVGPDFAVRSTRGELRLRNAFITQATGATALSGESANIQLDHVRVDNPSGRAVETTGGELAATDLMIVGNQNSEPTDIEGGVFLTNAVSSFARVEVKDQRRAGLLISGGRADIVDLKVDGVGPLDRADPVVWAYSESGGYFLPPSESQFFGFGLQALNAELRLERGAFERATGTGLKVVGGSSEISDLIVKDTKQIRSDVGGRPPDGMFGSGFKVSGTVRLERASLSGNGDAGIDVGRSGDLDASDIIVTKTLETPAIQLVQYAGGGGVRSVCGRITIRRFSLRENELSGFIVLYAGPLFATDGEIESSRYGVNAILNETRRTTDVILEKVAMRDMGFAIFEISFPAQDQC